MITRETTKLTPFAGTDLETAHRKRETVRRQRNILSDPDHTTGALFMTPPEKECTSREPEKRRLWPNGDSRQKARALHNGSYFARQKLYFVCRYLRSHCGGRGRGQRPRPDLGDLAFERDLPRIGQDRGARLRDGAGEIRQRQHPIEGRLCQPVDDRVPIRPSGR